MNKLLKTKNKFKNNEIDKWEFIDDMYDIHSSLFDYSEFLCDTNISKIEIIDNKVVMSFRDSKIKFICKKNDKRLAPLDVLNFNEYERAELDMQLALIDSDFTVFDIGGNFGWYAMNVAKSKPNSHVLTFEPIPSTFQSLNENIQLNKIENIESFNFGFSDKEGSFDFFYDPMLSVNASLANVSGNERTETVTCMVKELDNFINKENIKVDFIKCDVEGAEFFVFKGGVNLIKRDLPIIFTEMLRKWTAKFNYHPNEIIGLFKDLGYSCFSLNEGKLELFDLVTEDTTETNFFFLHNEKHVAQISRLVRTQI